MTRGSTRSSMSSSSRDAPGAWTAALTFGWWPSETIAAGYTHQPRRDPVRTGGGRRGLRRTAPTIGAWPVENPILASAAWVALFLIVFVPLCTARYSRPTS